MRLNALSVSAALHHPSTASEDQRYEEASHHCSDYCCVCRACFGTACGSGSDCVYRYRPGCPSSRRSRSLFSAQKSDRVVCGPLMDGHTGVDWEAVSGLAEITLKIRSAWSQHAGTTRVRRASSPGYLAERPRYAGATGLMAGVITKTQQENRNGAECASPSQPHYPRTATEDQRCEEVFQHCSDYCCARVCRACFSTAYGSGSNCEHRHWAGCSSARGVRSLVSALQSERGACWSARCGPYPQHLALVWLLEVMALLDEVGCDPTCDELMLHTPEAADGEFRALISKWRQQRPSRRLKE